VYQKESLLMNIAAKKLEDDESLFNEDDLTQLIAEQLNLPSRAAAKSVLRSIETQHGLLVERADELWSFSHLVLQEYLAAKWLMRLSPEEFGHKITEKRWQEIIIRLLESQSRSDRLLYRIKQATDYLIDDPQLQELIARHHKIDYCWDLTNEQQQKLHHYDDANKFLVKLLEIENAVSPEARQEIEDNLLLPIAELKRRLPDQYGGIEES
jgi:hypothetical protein